MKNKKQITKKGKVKQWRTMSIESEEEEKPSSRARERAKSLTLNAWAASWDASFPFISDSTNFSAAITISLFAISPSLDWWQRPIFLGLKQVLISSSVFDLATFVNSRGFQELHGNEMDKRDM